MTKEYKIKSLSKILLISTIVILLLGGTLIYYYSITVTKSTKTITITETKTVATTIFLDTDGDGIPNYKEKEYGTDPNKPNFLLAYALKKLPEQEALKFKNVENFNESSKVLVDYFSSLPENIRNSKEVNDLLNQILSDNIINELEKNLFYDKFVLPNLPLIFNLEWFPTREKLDKIYDINVTFVARDDNTPIAYAELHFVPVEYHYMIEKYGMRQEDYSKVFPPDNERVYVLTPIDGKFDSLEERFSVQITDIIGGREYKIVVLIRDLAGNEKIVEMKTPYIRQFENIAKTDDILITASYMPWYTDPKWVTEHNFKGYPLLGAYNVRDPIVIYKHADWATGHGIDAFLMNWNGADKSGDGNIKYIMVSLKDFKGAPKIGILWGPHPHVMVVNKDGKYDMNYLPNKEEFLREMNYLATTFMKDPNYLTTKDGRPIIYFYESKALKGDIPQLILDARNTIKNETGSNPFIIGNEIGWLFTYPEDWLKINGNSLTRLLSFDAISDWAASIDRSKQEYIDNYETYLDILYNKWSKFLRNYNTIFVGSTIPGFDEIYIYYTNDYPPIPKSPKLFKNRLEIAFNYMDPRFKMVRIDTWNDWSEWTNIEPTREELFGYLDIIVEILRSYAKN
jgi:hypothetical protein